jgi:hypothetical protein
VKRQFRQAYVEPTSEQDELLHWKRAHWQEVRAMDDAPYSLQFCMLLSASRVGWCSNVLRLGPWPLCGAPGDPLGRRERVGWLAASIVDAAVFHAVVRIPAQAIGLGFPRSGNIGSGPVE